VTRGGEYQQQQQQQQQSLLAPHSGVAYDNQVWTEYQDDLGRKCVAPPSCSSCMQHVCVTHGRYYHNVITNVTQWERPPAAAQRW
jgi:hypothetical protein